MARHKVVLIGAGSTVFTQRLVADMIASPRAGGWELALVDIDPTVLDLVHALVTKMVEARGVDLPVTATTDRRSVLPGARTVVTTIAVGGRRGWELDVHVPRRFGVFQSVGDTIMPGGISRGLRMVPPMVEIARDVGELCADADFFNYANPMAIVCRAVRKATGVPMVGLCHGVHYLHGHFARFLEVDEGTISSFGVGINHLTFFLELYHQGRDAWPLVRAKLDEQRPTLEAEIAAKDLFPNMVVDRPPRYADDPFSWTFFERHGAFPAMMDRHATEFFPERFPEGRYYGKQLGIDAFPIDARIAQGDATFDEMARLATSSEPLPDDFFEHVPGEHEELLEILTSREGDLRNTFSMNLPNGGAVTNLPADAVLEIPAVAAARGYLPLQAGELPPLLAAILLRKLATIEIAADAALLGSRELFIEALLSDGSVVDESTARDLADALIAAQRAHLPQFVDA